MNRPFIDGNSFILLPEPNIRVPYDAQVRGWRAFFSNTKEIHMQIWRHVSDLNYTLVGQTIHSADKTGISEVPLPPEQWFNVRAGDLLGMFFVAGGIIPCTVYTDGCNADTKMRLFANPGASLPGRNATFVLYDCRKYSLQVRIVGREYSFSL